MRASPVGYFVWGVLAVALVGLPLGHLFRRSFLGAEGQLTLANYFEVLRHTGLIEATLNSFIVAGGTTLGALVLAVPVAYYTTVTNMPWRKIFGAAAILTFAAPSFIAALGWILLLGPRGGTINVWLQGLLGVEEGPFNIFGPVGIIFVLSLFSYPLILLPVRAALANMDGSLHDAAQSLGAPGWRILMRIGLPLVTPAILAGSLLTFVTVFVVFGPVALLGSPVGFDTIPTTLLRLLRFPPRLELAAVLGVPVLLVLAGLLYAQRKIYGGRSYAVLGGRGGTPYKVDLGIGRWVGFVWCLGVMLFSLILPFGVLVVTSFRRAIGLPLTTENLVLENYVRLWEHPTIVSSLINSLVLAVTAAAASICVGILAAWLTERNSLWVNRLIPGVMLSPLAFPGAILGIAMILAYAGAPFRLGGTLTILFIAYIIRTMPLSYSYVQAGFRQLRVEMEEAARGLGASWTMTMRRVTAPLLGGSIASVGLLNFVLLFRELETSIFLFTGRNDVAAVILFNLAAESIFGVMGAFSVLILVINIGVVLIAQRLPGSQLRA